MSEKVAAINFLLYVIVSGIISYLLYVIVSGIVMV